MAGLALAMSWLRPAVGGACATLLGIGLLRFAYAPLLPAMVTAGWLPAGQAGALGAANLGGYLAGAMLAGAVARRLGVVAALRGAMLLGSVCFAACAVDPRAFGGLAWFLVWRVLAGSAGGVLMVLAGPAVQAAVPLARRGLAAGIVFTGVGVGIMAGAVLVPALLPPALPQGGLAEAWGALAAAAAALTAASWRLWPDVAAPPAIPMRRLPAGAGRLIAAYTMAALAATPHMVWWPDFIARGLGRGTATGAAFWFAYGVGASCGASLAGLLADRLGAARAFAAALAVQAGAIAMPLVADSDAALLASSVLAGGTAIGMTALALARARELAGEGASQVWRLATAAFGAAQTAMGFALAAAFAAVGSHRPLFVAGLAAAVAAAALAAPAGLASGSGSAKKRGATPERRP